MTDHEIAKYGQLDKKSLKITNNGRFTYRPTHVFYCKLLNMYLLSIRPIRINTSRNSKYGYVINYNMTFVIRTPLSVDTQFKQFKRLEYELIGSLCKTCSCIHNLTQNNLVNDMYSPIYQYTVPAGSNVCLFNVNVVGNEKILYGIRMYDAKRRKIPTEIDTLRQLQNEYFTHPLNIAITVDEVSFNGVKANINWKLVQLMTSTEKQNTCDMNTVPCVIKSSPFDYEKMRNAFVECEYDQENKQEFHGTTQTDSLIANVIEHMSINNAHELDELMFEDTLGNEI